jgi:hypothetical protein
MYLLIIVSPVYSPQLAKFLNKTCPTFFCPRLYVIFLKAVMVVYLTSSRVKRAFFGMSGPVSLAF